MQRIRALIGFPILLIGLLAMGVTAYLSFLTGSPKIADAGFLERISYWMFLNMVGPLWILLLGVILIPKKTQKDR